MAGEAPGAAGLRGFFLQRTGAGGAKPLPRPESGASALRPGAPARGIAGGGDFFNKSLKRAFKAAFIERILNEQKKDSSFGA